MIEMVCTYFAAKFIFYILEAFLCSQSLDYAIQYQMSEMFFCTLVSFASCTHNDICPESMIFTYSHLEITMSGTLCNESLLSE